MSIWKQAPTLEQLKSATADNAVGHMGIEFTAIGDDSMSARMPVDTRTVQTFGLLHGGASVLLAETLGSMAANSCVDSSRFYCVGLDINANHVRGARNGWVHGTARPLHLGKATQIWEIRIVDMEDRLVCISRLTMAVLARTPE